VDGEIGAVVVSARSDDQGRRGPNRAAFGDAAASYLRDTARPARPVDRR